MKRKHTKAKNQTISLSIPPEIIEQVVTLADKENRTISSMCAVLLRYALSKWGENNG